MSVNNHNMSAQKHNSTGSNKTVESMVEKQGNRDGAKRLDVVDALRSALLKTFTLSGNAGIEHKDAKIVGRLDNNVVMVEVGDDLVLVEGMFARPSQAIEMLMPRQHEVLMAANMMLHAV